MDAAVEAMLEMVGMGYAAALDPGQERPMLQRLDRTFQGLVSQTFVLDRTSQAVLAATISLSAFDAANASYARDWAARDPRNPGLFRLGSLQVVRCQELCSEAFVDRNEFFQEFAIPAGYRWGMAGAIHFADGTSRIMVSLRAPDMPAYSPQEADALRRLLPHFERANLLAKSLGGRSAGSLESVVTSLDVPAALVSAAGRIHEANALFEGLPQRLCAATGSVRFHLPDAQAAWLALLRRVAASLVPAAVEIRDLHHVPWRLELARCGEIGVARDGWGHELFLLTLRVSGSGSSVLDFSRRYAFTRAECETMDLLVRGLAVKEIAARRVCAVSTVRSHVAAMLQKAHCTSQRQLVLKFASQAWRH